MSESVLQDFEFEFRQEQERRLRKRVLWYCAITFGFGLLTLLIFSANIEGVIEAESRLRRPMTALLISSSLVSTVPYLWGLWHVWRKRPAREGMLKVIYWLLSISLIAGIVAGFAVAMVKEGTTGATSVFAFNVMFSILLSHVFACVLLPWTPRESLRPFYAPLAVGLGTVAFLLLLVSSAELWMRGLALLGFAAACTAVLMPGLAISWWKNNRFAREFLVKSLGNHYGEMRRELSGAQRIHESLFPPPQRRHGLDFAYAYAPMRSIGGDYLYARFLPSRQREHEAPAAAVPVAAAATGPWHHYDAPQGDDRPHANGPASRHQTREDLLVLLLDVCGHGITAALTVNRLYGELERLVAEDPQITPTELLCALNRYAYLTLSDHSLFVTALALRIEPPDDPSDPAQPATVHYANAGHPPACILNGSDASAMLGPTAMVLGVARELEVECHAATLPLPPGATLIAYTDGAMEARNAQGRMLNVQGVMHAAQQAASLPGDQRCAAVMSSIARHRFGPLSDDTLIVAVSRV